MNNFKKNIAVFGIMLASVCLTGCATSIVALNDDENKVVARYIADKLLQNDINYKKTDLVYIEPTEAPEPETSATPVPVQPTDVPQESQTPSADNMQTVGEPLEDGDSITSWDEFFTTGEWRITYSSYNTYKTYPENSDVYSINASDGNQLLVLYFDVKNLTDKKIKVDLSDSKLNYKLYIGENGYSPEIAVLDNGGLMYLRTSIPAGKTDKAELVFEIPEGAGFSDMRLDVSKQSVEG